MSKLEFIDFQNHVRASLDEKADIEVLKGSLSELEESLGELIAENCNEIREAQRTQNNDVIVELTKKADLIEFEKAMDVKVDAIELDNLLQEKSDCEQVLIL